jgi:GT2 family glycosyltransferase
VVVATRGRAEGALRAAHSVLADDYPSFDLQVVDQSDDCRTAQLLQPLGAHPRLRYLRLPPRGLAAARNAGVAAAWGDLVAFTDDDCEVGAGWLDAIAAAFRLDGRIGVTFGAVQAPAYDRGAGFIPTYARPRPYLARAVADKPRVEGIGACMAVRRSAWWALGGFDELLGAGAPFRSSEDVDFALRALLLGSFVYQTPDLRVTHHGFRPWWQARELIEDYMFGMGATYAKLLRHAGRALVPPLLALGWRWLAGRPKVDLNHVPSRRLRLAAFARGARCAARTPIDPATGRFRAP